ncbi:MULTISPECIES: LacI family DNA-binding transcriptional regulator [unclassified Microcella]|uniref:LacI family DNA-binding transcriptional regulator n=1 Tax=unclassified Microcella TaxID=2630066 RepID=UPI0006F57C81|nr:MULTISPECIES: LacI family DNA-binding transcriptional regulator [unclassified Microcella]KQV26027.1 LacI family transcriptional regulator [Yonghaparkia sp. Root332]KRF33169.1 LacI family transcriptional regulator [Yonghaparkia sp. Soil809]
MTIETGQARTAPTLEMVAAEAGVSRATVSRVVNASPKVSPDAVEAVQAAILRLGYTPNRAARSLANRRAMAIALVVPEDTARFFGDPYFAAVVRGISRVLDASDYVLNLHLANPGPSQKTVDYLLGGSVDGAIVVSHHSSDRFLEKLGGSIPVVFGGHPLGSDADAGAYFVDVDNAAAAEAGVRYLIEHGRTRIATITGPTDMPAGIDRVEGWRRALDAAGLEPGPSAVGDFTMVGGSRAARELLDVGGFDAIFVASDLMALGALSVLAERGVRVPDDIAVLGFDDSPAALAAGVPLTTVRQPSEEMGEQMARMLLQRLRGEETSRTAILPTDVVVRASA